MEYQGWKGGRVAEGARLESVFTLTRNVGSNPTLSAIINPQTEKYDPNWVCILANQSPTH